MKTEEMIAVMQAHKEGKTIQSRTSNCPTGFWWATPAPTWNWEEIEYRIKPREPRQCYVVFADGDKNPRTFGALAPKDALAVIVNQSDDVVLMREVIE